MTGGRIASSVARAFIVIGALLLAFVAFQLWGTSFYEHHAQDRLRQQFLASLHPSDPARPSCHASGGTGTTEGITVSVSRAACLGTGTKISVTASGLPANSVGAVTECNNSPNQPLVSLAGIAVVPVGCTDPLFTVRPVDAQGKLAPVSFAMRTGIVGPPAGGVDSTGAQASTDAAKYPCPPTPAQAAAGVSCVMRAGVLDVAAKTYVTAPVALAFGTSTGASSTPTTAPAVLPTTTTTSPSTTTTNAASSDSGVIGSASNVAPAGAPGIGQAVGLMSIPKIGMTNDAIVQGVGESQLQQGPGHYPGTPLPGQEGNAAIAGHRTTYAAPFYNLNQLQPGDPITIQTQGGLFHYQVTQSLVVAPTDVAVLNTSALPTLTLTTCNPRYSATTRLVVVALLVGAQRVASPSTPAATTTTAPGTGAHAGAPTPPGGSHQATDTSTANSGPTGSVGGALFWGAATLLAALAVRLLWRRLRRPVRWGALALGVPGVLVVLFVFFEHVSVALPASF